LERFRVLSGSQDRHVDGHLVRFYDHKPFELCGLPTLNTQAARRYRLRE
jgi:hypothetical protein